MGRQAMQDDRIVSCRRDQVLVDAVGRQVAATMKELSPATPVIMLTGWGQRLVAQGEVPANVDLVLSKPPRLRDVREALASCCGEA